MAERSHRFDEMSYEHAHRLARRSLQVMQSYLLHGVVVGDVDVDNLLDGVEVDDGDDPLLHDHNDGGQEAVDVEEEAEEEALEQGRMEED
jgi:hypothetical protein